jgi:hypothetical protein
MFVFSWFCGDAADSGLLISPAEICIILLFVSIIATLFIHAPKERELRETEEAIKRIQRPI